MSPKRSSGGSPEGGRRGRCPVVMCRCSTEADACEKFVKAAELEPGYGKAHYGWGITLAMIGQRAEAEEKWAKAAELDPALKPQIEEMRKQLLGKE